MRWMCHLTANHFRLKQLQKYFNFAFEWLLYFQTTLVNYSLLRPFLYITTNQPARKFKFLAELITFCVNICNIYEVNHSVNRRSGQCDHFQRSSQEREAKTINRSKIIYYNYKEIKWFTRYARSHLIPL